MQKIVLFLSIILITSASPSQLWAQTGKGFIDIPLQDLSALRKPDANWKIVGNVTADLDKEDVLTTKPGTGILVNLPEGKNRGDLVFQLEHGDMDLELEFLMAKHSNSGIYLQGRYEVQLFDSWGVMQPAFSDVGGIYERWDDGRAEGQKGYEGYAPRVNAAHAPGLWQKLKISFQAPRFNEAGVKIANARILKLELNGTVLHENLELNGPTRGQAFPGEAALGPLFFQGDHGPVAFRNIRYKPYTGKPAKLEQLQYAVYQGDYVTLPDFNSLTPKTSGKSTVLTQEVARMTEDLLLRYTGSLIVPQTGTYQFWLNTFGDGQVNIQGKTVIPFGSWDRTATVDLPAGTLPIEIIYNKRDNWFPNGLALEVEGPGFRRLALNALSSLAPANPQKPIIVGVLPETNMLRSFVDFAANDTQPTHRITRAISVGFPDKTSYGYNLDNGALFQVWKGGFLNATPMWDSRGDGNSKPDGAVLRFEDAPALLRIGKSETTIADTLALEADYRSLGYTLDAGQNPGFQYRMWNTSVNDRILSGEAGKSITRTIEIGTPGTSDLVFCLARGTLIEAISKQLYRINGQYYVQTAENTQIVVRGGQQFLTVPLHAAQTLHCTILW
jgi:hypothetical protein